MDWWDGLGREVGKNLRHAGEWGAGFEKIVLGADFGLPFVIGNR